MVEQALDDVRDLHPSIEFDEDAMNYMREFVGPLESNLKDLYQSMKEGSHEFAAGDLPLMEIAENYHDTRLPSTFLLKRINETHMKSPEAWIALISCG